MFKIAPKMSSATFTDHKTTFISSCVFHMMIIFRTENIECVLNMFSIP